MRRTSLIFLLSLLVGCASTSTNQIDTTNYSQLENIAPQGNGPKDTPDETSPLRVKALQDTAMSLGAQAALAWQGQHINTKLEQHQAYLNTVFNFDAMLLSHGVLPPVLVEGDNSLNLASSDTIRISDKTYKIEQQAKFVTTPPTWHDYLIQTFTKPDMPARSMLPRNRDEQKIWRKYLRIGWQTGLMQGTNIFKQNLAHIKRDFQGMLLYRKLLAAHMVSPPYVSKTELGVTGNGTTMRVNDQVLRITVMPQLQTDTSGWKAQVVTNNGQ